VRKTLEKRREGKEGIRPAAPPAGRFTGSSLGREHMRPSRKRRGKKKTNGRGGGTRRKVTYAAGRLVAESHLWVQTKEGGKQAKLTLKEISLEIRGELLRELKKKEN